MQRLGSLHGSSRPWRAAPCAVGASRPRIAIGSVPPRLGLPACHRALPPSRVPLRHGPPPCRAAAGPEDSDLAAGYDSDDYELLEEPAAAPRTATHAAAATPANSDASPRTRAGAGSTRAAIKSGFNIFLLFGAAIDRSVSRVQAILAAAATAVLAALRSALAATGGRLAAAGSGVKSAAAASPAGRRIDRWARAAEELQRELPNDTWGKLLWLWDRPPVQRLRLTVSMANLSIRLPALLALVATQVGLLASQVSLPMLAPLLLGTGMMMRSIKTNASFLLPRIGLLVVMLWVLWFVNSVVHNTVAYLRKQGAVDQRLAGGIITVCECSALVVALVVVLSMLGVNVSALLLPAGIAVAVAAKDLSHNFLAGLFLFVVQPFKLGDRLSVSSSAPGAAAVGPSGWFEGVIEKVDLRYVIVRQGRRRLMVPNSAFITREFMVVDDGPGPEPAPPPPPGAVAGQFHAQPFLTNDYRHVWQYVEGPPVHQELAATAQQQQQAPVTSAQQQQQQATVNSSNAAQEMAVNGSSGAPNGAAAGPGEEAASAACGSPPPPPPPGSYTYVPVGAPGSAGGAHFYTQQQLQQQQHLYGGGSGTLHSPPPPPAARPAGEVNGNVPVNAATGYWQQQQQPVVLQQQYRSGTVWSHPLSPEAWRQHEAAALAHQQQQQQQQRSIDGHGPYEP